MNIDILPLNSEIELNEAFERAVNHLLKCSRWKLTESRKKKRNAGRGHRITMLSKPLLQMVFFLPTDENFLGHLADSSMNCAGVI